MLTKIISSFEGENKQKLYNDLDYRIDLYFHDYKFAIENDENRQSDINIDYQIKRQKVIGQELNFKFIRTHPAK